MAITQVLLGFRGLILARVRGKIYLPTLIWAGFALPIAIRARQVIENLGMELATPAEAREILSLKGAAHVAF